MYIADAAGIPEKRGLSSHFYADDVQLYLSCRRGHTAVCASRVSMTSPNGWPQTVWWLILPRLTSYGVRQANHHFHQPALPYNRRSAFVISVCCSTATCLSRFTSTSLLLAATVLCAVSRVVDVHSVVVHQLLWLTVSLSRSWTIATAFSLAATSNSQSRWQTSTCTELRSSSDLWRRPSRARNSTAIRDKFHWLRARERITFKLCLLVYKARNGMAPNYIQDLCVPVSTVSTRSALRSAARGDLVIPRTRRRLGNRAFSVAGPAA